MSDDKSKRGKPDRSRVAGQEKWEVAYVARQQGVTQAKVKEAVKEVGPSRTRVIEYIKRNK
jgi:hypothetical protein